MVTAEDGWAVVWDCSEHDIGNLLADHPGAFIRAPRPLAVPAHVADPYGEDYPDVMSACCTDSGVTSPSHCASGDTADCAKVGAPALLGHGTTSETGWPGFRNSNRTSDD